jgi:hypothetical protein
MVLVALMASTGCHSTDEKGSDTNKAAIIDQLYLLEPNPSLIDNATQVLEDYGFPVDLWQGAEVTVDFYRNLPAKGYGLILFRVHSGLLMTPENDEHRPQNPTYLFTAENYTTTRYVPEQLTDKVSSALMYERQPPVFAVNSAFIKGSQGLFANTVVLLLGCESYRYDDMAAAFIEKGASAYVGWNTVVSLEHADKAILNLLGNLCIENMTLAGGISRTMAELGEDPNFGAYLKYCPSGSGGKTVRELIGSKRE